MGWWHRAATVVAVIALVALAGACSDDTGADASPDTTEPITSTTTTALPDQDLSVEIEPGRVAFHTWADDASRQLAVVPTAGSTPVELAVDGTGGVAGASVAPDGQTIAALAWAPGEVERNTSVLVGTVDGGLRPVFTDADLTLWCVRWYPSGDQLLVTAFADDEVDPVLLTLDLDGSTTALTVPPGRYECAVPLDDDSIVLTYVGEGTDFVGMAIVRPSDSESELLATKTGCLLYGPSRSWARDELVVAASCEEPTDSGIHLVDLDTGELEQIVVAEAAFPSFAPSGDWITFGRFPSPDALKSTIWAVARDGRGLRELTDVVGAQPAWVGPAVAGP